MLEALDVFLEWTKLMLRLAKDAGLWQLRDWNHLPTWYHGRAIIVGDGSHATLPTQGQGASQVVEDAEALGAYFADAAGGDVSLEEVERRNKVSQIAPFSQVRSLYLHLRLADGLRQSVRTSIDGSGIQPASDQACADNGQGCYVSRLGRYLLIVHADVTGRNPGEFMDYNCNYRGAMDWFTNHEPSSAEEVLKQFMAIAQ